MLYEALSYRSYRQGARHLLAVAITTVLLGGLLSAWVADLGPWRLLADRLEGDARWYTLTAIAAVPQTAGAVVIGPRDVLADLGDEAGRKDGHLIPAPAADLPTVAAYLMALGIRPQQLRIVAPAHTFTDAAAPSPDIALPACLTVARGLSGHRCRIALAFQVFADAMVPGPPIPADPVPPSFAALSYRAPAWPKGDVLLVIDPLPPPAALELTNPVLAQQILVALQAIEGR